MCICVCGGKLVVEVRCTFISYCRCCCCCCVCGGSGGGGVGSDGGGGVLLLSLLVIIRLHTISKFSLEMEQ